MYNGNVAQSLAQDQWVTVKTGLILIHYMDFIRASTSGASLVVCID